MLHDRQLRHNLAIEVAKVGFKADQTYFYLGRATEGLGYYDNARTYYNLGLTSEYKCEGILNKCDRLVFPGKILTAINRLPYLGKAKSIGKTINASCLSGDCGSVYVKGYYGKHVI